MQLEFNFVATTYRNSRHELEHELKALLKDFEPIVFFPLKLNSVSYGKLNGDPIKASEILWNLAYSDPWKVRRTLRFVPLEINCNVETIELKKKAKEIAAKRANDLLSCSNTVVTMCPICLLNLKESTPLKDNFLDLSEILVKSYL